MELSKKDKKVAREIIEKGLQKEFANGLNEAYAVLQKWKKNDLENRDAYYLLFKTITDFDKHIARRYDRISGSTYFLIVTSQFAEGIISEEDLKDFSPEIREKIYLTNNLFGEE